MIELTVFASQYDNRTNRRVKFDDWGSFVSTLKASSRCRFASKKAAELISPAIYKPNTTRAINNVEKWAGWLALDIDSMDITSSTMHIAFEQFNSYQYVCYSTASSSHEQPKFRLVLPLSRDANGPTEIQRLWYATNRELGDVADPQTKDVTRMFYVPGNYASAEYQFFIDNRHGQVLDVDELLAKWPYQPPKDHTSVYSALPEYLQQAVREYRQNRASNIDATWTDYTDCPFVPQSLIEQYKNISDGGWYRMLYRIMVATAINAIEADYPITEEQIEQIARDIDRDNGLWYKKRPFKREAANALAYAYQHAMIG